MSAMDYPLIVFAVSLVTLWVSAKVGAHLHKKWQNVEEIEREDLAVILAATLTLLGLIIGFSFSMAVSRYDRRKDYEEAEANAIGTEYVRAGLLPAADASKLRELLTKYVSQRILFYTTRSARQLDQINTSTTRLESDMWAVIQARAVEQPTPIAALIASGMNDVLNSQGYTQAAWWNRIPIAAWGLVGAIGICSNLLLGYTSRRGNGKTTRFFILPMLVSVSIFLIADLDSPRGGVIRVSPQNLMSLEMALSEFGLPSVDRPVGR
jgi:hypothetical protein